MSLRRYECIKDLMDIAKSASESFIKMGHPEIAEDVVKDYKRKIRKAYKDIDRDHYDQLSKPITEEWRTIIDDPEDIALSGKHYRILLVDNQDEWTDEEIREYIMDEVGYPDIWEPWDCTGKRFTRWCSWSIQPIGIVMIHAWGTDL